MRKPAPGHFVPSEPNRIDLNLTIQLKTVLDTCEVLGNVPDKKYKCSNCSYSTNYKSNLNKHQKTKKCQAVEVEEDEEKSEGEEADE